MQTLSRLLICAVIISAGAVGLSGQGRDPRTGTWRLNVAKSTYKPGPAPRSQIVRIEPSGQGEHVRSEVITENRTKVVTDYTAAYDDTDYPIKGSPVANMVMLKRIDANTTERYDKKDGHVMLIFPSADTTRR